MKRGLAGVYLRERFTITLTSIHHFLTLECIVCESLAVAGVRGKITGEPKRRHVDRIGERSRRAENGNEKNFNETIEPRGDFNVQVVSRLQIPEILLPGCSNRRGGGGWIRDPGR